MKGGVVIMLGLKRFVKKAGKLWLFGAGMSALIGLLHGILTYYAVI